jgi:HemY protein
MLKALWFMVKVGLLTALAVWIAERPGTVKVEWLEYTLTVHVGFFLLAFLGTMLLAILIYNIIRTFVDFPKAYRRYAEIKGREKGYRALTLGLTAVAAGDAKTAVKEAQRSRRLLYNDTGLPLLLEAQAARLDGREEDARRSFIALLENKDAGFLGVRGLLQAALDMGNYTKALELAQQALKLYPKQPWILRTVYDLEIRQRHWEVARTLLQRAEKTGAMTAEQIKSDRAAIYLAEAEEAAKQNNWNEAIKKAKKAADQNPGFTPATLRLARLYNNSGNRRKAVAMVEKAWKAQPHPELATVWDALVPPKKSKKPLSRMAWFEKLVEMNPNAMESHLAAGRAAMEEGLWGEARQYFRRAEEIESTARLYTLWTDLEERAGQGEDILASLAERAATVLPDKTWVCRETGRIYPEWSPIAQPHGAFNTIEWAYPYGSAGDDSILIERYEGVSEVLLEAPRA